MLRVKLLDIMKENNQGIELIIQSIDEEFNEDDWMLTDDESKQQQLQHIEIQLLNSSWFANNEWPIALLDQCNIHWLKFHLKTYDYVLLEIYDNQRFYICHQNQMKQKVVEHMNRTQAYILIQDLCRTDTDYVQRLLNQTMEEIMTKLDELLRDRRITEDQAQQMRMVPSKIRLDFLSFQPDTKQVRIECILLLLFFYFHSVLDRKRFLFVRR